MNFDPCNHLLKIQKSIRTTIPKMGTSFLAHTFASPCLGRKPKGRVTTLVHVEFRRRKSVNAQPKFS
jgi:hypothetical protein